jgi:Flp pilus assembly protein TadG
MKLLRSERGATMTEVAFVLPVFLLFLMIVMEGGRVLGAWIVLTNTTRETARWVVAANQQTDAYWGTICTGLTGCQGNCAGQNDSATLSCVEANLSVAAKRFETGLVGSMLSASTLSFSPTPSPSFTDDGSASVTSVTMTATYTVNTLTPLLQKVVKSFSVYSTATMRAEA